MQRDGAAGVLVDHDESGVVVQRVCASVDTEQVWVEAGDAYLGTVVSEEGAVSKNR